MAKRLGEEQPLVFTARRLMASTWLDHRLFGVLTSIPRLRHIFIEDSPSHGFWMILSTTSIMQLYVAVLHPAVPFQPPRVGCRLSNGEKEGRQQLQQAEKVIATMVPRIPIHFTAVSIQHNTTDKQDVFNAASARVFIIKQGIMTRFGRHSLRLIEM